MIEDTFGKENLKALLYTLSNIPETSEKHIEMLEGAFFTGENYLKFTSDVSARESILKNIQMTDNREKHYVITYFEAVNFSWVVFTMLLIDIKDTLLYANSHYPVVREVVKWRLNIGS
jgi:hypothetical protein